MITKLKLSSVYIEITSKCNRNCPYCYNDSNIDGTFLGFDNIKKIIDTCVDENINQITLSGGEPFLHPNIKQIIEYANEKGVYVLIITNLSCVALKDAISILKRGNFLQLTLDSVIETKNDETRGVGSFYLVRNLLEETLKNSLQKKIVLRMNVSKANKNEIEAFVEFAKYYKLTQATTVLLANSGRSLNYKDCYNIQSSIIEVNSIIEKMKTLKEKNKEYIKLTFSDLEEQRGCAVFGNGEIKVAPRIDSMGNVFFCSYFFGEENSFGNILKSDLNSIINSNKAFNFISKVRKRKINKNCAVCPFNHVCACGCPAVSYMNANSIFYKDDQCHVIKYFIKNKLKSEANKYVFKSE